MPQNLREQATNTFVGGLITEAGELTFPPNASVDESNCDLLRDGSRRRRLGIAKESNGSLSTESDSTGDAVVTVNRWFNVGEEAGVEFVVTQVGRYVWFYEFSSTGNLSDNRVDTTDVSGVDFQLDLVTYERSASVLGAASAPIQTASIKGGLVIASPEIDTILIERNVSTGAFTISTIDFQIRDYQYQGDITTYDAEVASGSVTVQRRYDTQNAGWVQGSVATNPLSTYVSARTAYPALTHPWYSGKNATGDFSVAEWRRVFSGNSLITNGHYVYNLYNINRDTASGLSGLTTTTEDSRFSTVTGFAGRVFYSGMFNSTGDNGSKIFFSQLLDQGFEKIGLCYQANDPTSEELSDLLDTDGGFISIPEAYNIRKLHVFGPSLYVMADNGIWVIKGVDDVFRATEYSVSKLSEDGIENVSSFVSAAGRPYWWSAGGIFTLGSTQLGDVEASNLSVGTIQSYWEDIPAALRDKVQGAYDPVNRRVVWAYPNQDSFDNKLNEIIIYDEALQAWIPWTVSDKQSDPDWIVGLVNLAGAGTQSVTYNVVDSQGNQVVDSSGDDVTVVREGRELASSRIKYFVRDGATGRFTFAEFTETEFLDWEEADYSSFAESAFDFEGSLELRYNIPYITTFCRTTETGWRENADGTGFEPIRDSSLKLSVFWDFKTTPGAAEQEVYRRKRTPVVDTTNLGEFGYPHTVIVSRIRPRGRGRVARLRWESSTGKDFHLLGWSTMGASNARF